ncbi:hypothetical protein AADZ86_11920 [Colwelliaceae bacterium BS250]
MKQAALIFLFGVLLTVVISGLYGFVFPFNKTSVTVHVFFALLMMISIDIHLYERRKSLFKFIDLSQGRKYKLPALGLLITLVAVSLLALPPASSLMELSYENRHRDSVFRASKDVVSQEIDGQYKVLKQTEEIRSFLEVLVHEQSDDIYLAVWAEDDFGNMIEPLFISDPLKYTEKNRQLYLPVWSHRLKKKQANFDNIDGISSATIRSSFKLNGIINARKNGFHLKVEVNVVNDENEFYHPGSDNFLLQSPEGIGQPSVIYATFIDLQDDHLDSWHLLKFEGKSDVEGLEGNIIPNAFGLTTSLKIINRALLHIDFTKE